VNGTIAAVPPALPHDGRGLLFSAMLPERDPPIRAADLALLLVTDSPDGPRLHPVPTAIGAAIGARALGPSAPPAAPNAPAASGAVDRR
jgi:hypothetical protein